MSGKNNHRPALPLADLEPDISHAPLAKKKVKGCTPRACIHVHSYRKRLADSDGVSAKAVIDGIVKAGVLVDDSPQFVTQVSYGQEKTADEKTVITVTFLPDKP